MIIAAKAVNGGNKPASPLANNILGKWVRGAMKAREPNDRQKALLDAVRELATKPKPTKKAFNAFRAEQEDAFAECRRRVAQFVSNKSEAYPTAYFGEIVKLVRTNDDVLKPQIELLGGGKVGHSEVCDVINRVAKGIARSSKGDITHRPRAGDEEILKGESTSSRDVG